MRERCLCACGPLSLMVPFPWLRLIEPRGAEHVGPSLLRSIPTRMDHAAIFGRLSPSSLVKRLTHLITRKIANATIRN